MMKPFKNDSRKNKEKNEKNVHQRDTTPLSLPSPPPRAAGGVSGTGIYTHTPAPFAASRAATLVRKLPALRTMLLSY